MKQYLVRIKDAMYMAQYEGNLSYLELRAVIAVAARKRVGEDPHTFVYMQTLNLELKPYDIVLSEIEDVMIITQGS